MRRYTQTSSSYFVVDDTNEAKAAELPHLEALFG
jgi:hypothetical protein